MALVPGLSHQERDTVTEHNTAAAVGSGGVSVYGSPFMIGLMEMAAARCVQPHLEAGQTTVGTAFQISHVAATPIGMGVWAEATLEQVDGRRLVFAVTAYDDAERIGEGRHERFIVQVERFVQRTAAKAAGKP